jgi:hypothetical protein
VKKRGFSIYSSQQSQPDPEHHFLHRSEIQNGTRVRERQPKNVDGTKSGHSQSQQANVLCWENFVDEPLDDEWIEQCQDTSPGDA